jgi:uncharacterized protein YukE
MSGEPAPIDPPERPDTVTVVRSESLSEIAEEFFEDPSLWKSIYDANRDVIGDPDSLRPGTELRLPLEMYPDHVRAVAGVFDTERTELGDFVAQAAKDLDALGDFWGNGEQGTGFYRGESGGTGYEAAATQAIEGIGSLLDAYEEIPDRLRLTADRVQVGDWDNVTTLLDALPSPHGDDPPIWGEGG